MSLFVCVVLGPPRSVQLTLVQDDPPVVMVKWQAPRTALSAILGYKVEYGIRRSDGEETDEEDEEDEQMEQKILDGDKYQMTTGFIGQYVGDSLLRSIHKISEI